jgi:hypothetical protein
MPALAAASAAGAARTWRAVAVGLAAGTVAVVRSAKALMTERPAAKSPALPLMHRELGNRARRRHVVLALRQRGADEWTMAEPDALTVAIFCRAVFLVVT